MFESRRGHHVKIRRAKGVVCRRFVDFYHVKPRGRGHVTLRGSGTLIPKGFYVPSSDSRGAAIQASEMKFYFVYVLRSLKDFSWYIGFTEDLKNRVKEHNTGGNTSTKNKTPYELIYFEGYLNKLDALGREKFLKSGSGRRFIKEQLKHYLFGANSPNQTHQTP